MLELLPRNVSLKRTLTKQLLRIKRKQKTMAAIDKSSKFEMIKVKLSEVKGRAVFRLGLLLVTIGEPSPCYRPDHQTTGHR